MSDSAAAASFLSHFQVSSFPPVSAPRQVSPPCLGGRILQSWDILLWILKWQSYFDINHFPTHSVAKSGIRQMKEMKDL